MKTTLEIMKKLDKDCEALLRQGKLDEAVEISNMILRAHKKGLVEEDAWDFFNSWDKGIKNNFI